jgi:hypothetical protein
MYISHMALKTNLEMCEIYQKAIIAIAEGCQSYSIGEGPESKSYSKADIDKLHKAFDYWNKRYQAETRGSGMGIILPVF